VNIFELSNFFVILFDKNFLEISIFCDFFVPLQKNSYAENLSIHGDRF